MDFFDPLGAASWRTVGASILRGGVMISHDGVVTGVTTAAVVWVLAAVGASIGLGHVAGAIVLAVVVVALLVIVGFLERRVLSSTRGAHAKGDASGFRPARAAPRARELLASCLTLCRPRFAPYPSCPSPSLSESISGGLVSTLSAPNHPFRANQASSAKNMQDISTQAPAYPQRQWSSGM